jgi:hypothetical protein
MTNEETTPMLEFALTCARIGWAVFPCDWREGSHAKAPMTEHGHLEATRGEAIIREWWERWPLALIGGRVPQHLLVIDIDPRNGGSQEALEALAGELPRTLTAESGRGDGGRHHYYRRPTTVTHDGEVDYFRLAGSRLPKGIDLKVNGYCILPPSLHPSTGKPYRWVIGAKPVDLPRTYVELLTPKPPKARPGGTLADTGGLLHTVRSAGQGERNEVLYWAACRIVEAGGDEAVLETAIQAGMDAGLSEREARRTVESAQQMYS